MLAMPNGSINTADSVNSFLNFSEDVKGANGFAQLFWPYVFWRYEMKSNLIWVIFEKYWNHKKKGQIRIYIIYSNTFKKKNLIKIQWFGWQFDRFYTWEAFSPNNEELSQYYLWTVFPITVAE